MDEQETVEAFLETHDLEAPPAYCLLDLVSELGAVAKDALESTEYGSDPASLEVNEDELGDALFSLLALSASLEIDASDALVIALEKYEGRLESGSSPGSTSDL